MTLVQKIAELRSKLADEASGLALAERRVEYFAKRAKVANDPDDPHPQLLDRATKRLHYWREKQRRAHLRRHHLRVALRRSVKKLARLGPRRKGQRVVGGTPSERLLWAARYGVKHWHDRYSQLGEFVWDYALTNSHNRNRRTDCSWWYIVVRYICGLGKCVEGSVLFTGSILEQGRIVDRHYAETHTGVAVVFGDGSGFHVGMSSGHGPFIFEHGTPTLNTGHFDQYGPGTTVRYRAFD